MLGHRLKTILGVASITLIAVIGLLMVTAKYQGYRLLSVQSESMVPRISKGDLVAVKNVPEQQLAVGDVITYTDPVDPALLITHRIVKLQLENSGAEIVTKGDANAAADLPISTAAVVGRVNKIIPAAGKAVDALRKPIVLALIVYLPALMIIISELRRLERYYRSQQGYWLENYHHHEHHNHREWVAHTAKVVALVIVGSLLIASPALALQSQAQLTGNTISYAKEQEPEPEPEPQPPTCPTSTTNNSNVTVNNSNNQTTNSGDATVSGNQTGGSATSGDASSTNNTSTTVVVNQNSCSQTR